MRLPQSRASGGRRAGQRDAGVTALVPDVLEAAADPYGYRYAAAW